MHRYLPPGVEEGTPCHDSLSQPLSVDGPGVATEGDAVDTSPFEKFDPLLHIGIADPSGRHTRSKAKKREILSNTFIKKYIQYAKSKPAPALTKGAADYIVNVYASLRNEVLEGNRKKVMHFEHVMSSNKILITTLDVSLDCSYPRDADSSGYRACKGTLVTQS
jgi:DNA replication licensing factor MCM3